MAENSNTNRQDFGPSEIFCYETISYIISYHIVPYHNASYHTIQYHTISYHIISYHIILSYHIISPYYIAYTMAWHVILLQIPYLTPCIPLAL